MTFTVASISFCYVCISGITREWWTCGRESKYIDFKMVFLCVTATKMHVTVSKISRRGYLERRGSKVPVETEAQEENR